MDCCTTCAAGRACQSRRTCHAGRDLRQQALDAPAHARGWPPSADCRSASQSLAGAPLTPRVRTRAAQWGPSQRDGRGRKQGVAASSIRVAPIGRPGNGCRRMGLATIARESRLQTSLGKGPARRAELHGGWSDKAQLAGQDHACDSSLVDATSSNSAPRQRFACARGIGGASKAPSHGAPERLDEMSYRSLISGSILPCGAPCASFLVSPGPGRYGTSALCSARLQSYVPAISGARDA